MSAPALAESGPPRRADIRSPVPLRAPTGGAGFRGTGEPAVLRRRHAKRRRKSPDSGGRPTKFTAPTALTIVAAVARDESLDEAARSAGVGPSILYRWLALGRAGDGRFAALADALGEARRGSANGRAVATLGLHLLRKGF